MLQMRSYPQCQQGVIEHSQHNVSWLASDCPKAGLNAVDLHMNNFLSKSQLLAHEVSARLELI